MYLFSKNWSNEPLNRSKKIFKPSTDIHKEFTETLNQNKEFIIKDPIENIEEFPKNLSKDFNVISSGPINSALMILGEYDEGEIPFEGENGELLEKMLNAINLYKKDIFITNTIFKNNFGEKIKNIDLYFPVLEKIIETVKPKIILGFGGSALNSLGKNIKNLNGKSISEIRGQILSLSINSIEIPCVFSFHPTYILRKPNIKKLVWEDLLKIKELFLKLI